MRRDYCWNGAQKRGMKKKKSRVKAAGLRKRCCVQNQLKLGPEDLR